MMKRVVTFFALGVLLSLACLFISVFVTDPALGFAVDSSKLPAEVQKILTERPNLPLDKEQWNRIKKIMDNNGGWPSEGSITARGVLHSWYVFVLLPIGVWAVILWLKGRRKWYEVSLISIPSIFVLVIACLSI
jgi:hypothetical protein